MARCPRNRRTAGQSADGLHPKAVPPSSRAAGWPFHNEIAVDSRSPACKVDDLEMLKRKFRSICRKGDSGL